MASDQSFVDHVVDQIEDDCGVTSKKMFGEYGLFSQGKMFGLVCDNRFFVKPTDAGRDYMGSPVEAPPYPGAKNAFLVEDLDDRAWLSELVRITTRELPSPKRKKKR